MADGRKAGSGAGRGEPQSPDSSGPSHLSPSPQPETGVTAATGGDPEGNRGQALSPRRVGVSPSFPWCQHIGDNDGAHYRDPGEAGGEQEGRRAPHWGTSGITQGLPTMQGAGMQEVVMGLPQIKWHGGNVAFGGRNVLKGQCH